MAIAAAAGKRSALLIIIALFFPALAQAGTCYGSSAVSGIAGMPSGSRMIVMWNENGSAMDEIRIVREKLPAVSTEMLCLSAAPISCTLGSDGGHVRLIFDANGLKVISNGLEIGGALGTPPRLSLKRTRANVVTDLVQLSADECKVHFPNPKTIRVFQEEEQTGFSPATVR